MKWTFSLLQVKFHIIPKLLELQITKQFRSGIQQHLLQGDFDFVHPTQFIFPVMFSQKMVKTKTKQKKNKCSSFLNESHVDTVAKSLHDSWKVTNFTIKFYEDIWQSSIIGKIPVLAANTQRSPEDLRRC